MRMVVRYDEFDYDIRYGEEWFERYRAAVDTRSVERMHKDAVGQLQQATVASDLYDAEVRSDVRVTGRGTGLNLYVSDTEGVFVWFAPDAAIEVPTIVRACLERVDA